MVDAPPKDLTFTAVGKRVLVAPVPDQLETESGLDLVEPNHKTPCLGVVVSVGPKAAPILKVKPGDAVYYMRGSGVEIEANGHTLVFLMPDRIIGRAQS